MTIKNMTFVFAGAVLAGIISGIVMRSIFGGLAFTILLLFFFILSRYIKSEEKSQADMKAKEDKENTSVPPVSVKNIPSQVPQQNTNPPQYSQPAQPTYPQNTQKGI